MGPGTKLPTPGHTEYAVLRDVHTEVVVGKLDSGADAILVDSCLCWFRSYSCIPSSRRMRFVLHHPEAKQFNV